MSRGWGAAAARRQRPGGPGFAGPRAARRGLCVLVLPSEHM